MAAKHFRTCHLCEAMCGVVIEHEGERVLSIRGDDDDHFSQGHICPKAVALQDLQNDPDRLRTPMRRVGSAASARWEPLGWDEALDLAGRELTRIRSAHGKNSLAVYLGNPTVHSMGAIMYAPFLLRALGTKNRFSATSVDQLPHHVAATTMFGHALLIPIPDLDRCQHLLILGANPAASKGSLLTAGDAMARIKAIKDGGGKVVLVDPRRTETASSVSEHHFIRPGTDALLLLAMLNVIFEKKLERLGSIERFTKGLDAIRSLASSFPPVRVADVTGIAAAAIEKVAVEFAQAERAACYGRIGISHQEHGALACWLVTVLNAVTGRIDVPGGTMFTKPAVDVVRVSGAAGFSAARFARWKSRVRGLPEFGGELPVVVLAEEIETPGEGQIRGLLTHAGNPVLSTPNGTRLDRALATLDFYVAIDFYVNETTRHANLILPPTGPLERDQYDVVFHALAVRNTAKYSSAMIERGADARHDWEILNELTWRVARGGTLARIEAKARARALAKIAPRGLLDIGLRTGPYGSGPKVWKDGLTVKKLLAEPHGVDLGPLEPRLPGYLRTADKMVDLAPKVLMDDAKRLDELADGARARTGMGTGTRTPNNRLALIGRRDLRSNNSWMHNAERLVKGKARCTLYLHPDDARARNIAAGAKVKVTSDVGSVVVDVELTDSVMPGVVSLPHGWGHDRAGVHLAVAGAHAGASFNDLSDDKRVDPLCGNAAFSGTEVEVALA